MEKDLGTPISGAFLNCTNVTVPKGMGKRGARVSRERTTGNPVNANNNMQAADDDITREDAETFLAIVELLDQLY